MTTLSRPDDNGWVTCSWPALFGLEACQAKFKPTTQEVKV